MALTKPTELVSRPVVMRDPDPGSRYAVVCEAVKKNETPGGAAIYYPGQPICYMAACNGKYIQVADRIIYLLNKYGLEETDSHQTDPSHGQTL